jgi:hypothetical protein
LMLLLAEPKSESARWVPTKEAKHRRSGRGKWGEGGSAPARGRRCQIRLKVETQVRLCAYLPTALGGSGLGVPCTQACFGKKRSLPQRGPFSSALPSVALGEEPAMLWCWRGPWERPDPPSSASSW